MMRFNKPLIVLVLLFGVGVTFSFGQWRWWIGNYPSVADTPHDQLGYWLVLVDLEDQDESLREELVDRFQSELSAGWSPLEGSSASSDGVNQALLEKNIDVLTQQWFYQRSAQFHQLKSIQQRPFLEIQLATVMQWADIHHQIYSRSSGTAELSPFALFDRIEPWVQQAPLIEHSSLRKSIHNAVLYWLCTEDVLNQDLQIRRELAERLAEALDEHAGNNTVDLQLTDQHQAVLSSNAFALVEVWLLNRAVEYMRLSDSQRESYLDAQLDTVRSWELEKMLISSNASTDESIAQLTKVLGNLTAWADRAPVAHREAYHLFARELQQHVLKKLLNL